MSKDPNKDDEKDNDATSAQFTAILLRYLARRADQARRRARADDTAEGVTVQDDDEPFTPPTDDDPFSSDPDDINTWDHHTFFGKRKTQPKLDLIDDNLGNFAYLDEHKESLGRLQQWIDDGHIEINYNELKDDLDKPLPPKTDHPPLICNNKRNGSCHTFLPYNFAHYISLRELGACSMYNNRGAIGHCSDHFFSNNVIERFQGNSRVFCSDFSSDGSVLCVASQDHVIHLIDSSSGVSGNRWPIYKQVESQFSGWSIIDVALSPDHEFVAYSGWSSSIFLVNTYGSHELHEEHNLNIS
eukprot:326096_1